MAYDDRVTYTIVVDYTQNSESDLHYAELKTEMVKRLKQTAIQSKGTSEAQMYSFAAA